MSRELLALWGAEVHIEDLKRQHEVLAAAAEATLRREIDAVTKMFATTLRLEEFKCVRLEDEVARLTSQLELATTTSRGDHAGWAMLGMRPHRHSDTYTLLHTCATSSSSELDQKILMDRLSSEAALGSQERRFREEVRARMVRLAIEQ